MAWRCSPCIFAVVVGNVVLMAVPQAREALQVALTGGDLWSLRTLFHVGAVLYWAATAWFVARLLLSRKFKNDSLGADADPPFVHWVAVVLPRLLAILATFPVCLLTFQRNRMLGLVTSIAAGLFLGLLVLRTRFGDVLEKNTYGHFERLGASGRQATLGLLTFSAVLLGGLWSVPAGRVLAGLWLAAAAGLWQWDRRRTWVFQSDAQQRWGVFVLNLFWGSATLSLMASADDEIGLARSLTSPAILLFALGSWTVFGGFVLTYLTMARWSVGVAHWLPLVLYLAGSVHETHWIAQRAVPGASAMVPAEQDWRQERVTVNERFAAWLRQVPPGEPIYMAALVGGASRAAYWSGSVLARLDDEARQTGQRFAANLFAISSVSGGSLGAAAFVSDLAQFPDAAVCGSNVGTEIQPEGGCRTRRIEKFLGGDFLSPVIGRMLFPDLATRFVPFPLPRDMGTSADRSLGLEEAWAQDWERSLGNAMPALSWRRPLTELYALAERETGPHLPALLLNTVRLEDGQRFLQSNVRMHLPDVMDLLDPAIDTRRLTLAQAVHNSARFPYVSPGGMVLASDTAGPHGPPDAARLGRLGDGGYHEASGAATLADLLETMTNDRLLRPLPDRTALWACRDGWTMQAGKNACPVAPSPVVALLLDSEPSTFPVSYVRDLDGQPASLPQGTLQDGMPLPEVLGPVFGGLSTRTDLSRESQQRLSRLVGKNPSALIELRMPLWRTTQDEALGLASCHEHTAQPSMNWALDACSLDRLGQASAEMP
ncbi:hypothetical protein, partial [Sphaerotilus sp.]|uniref:hypothetical protein n=1 Tax=Sphaerotilus sp. TaxID=2093942 RepID=UPI0034E1BE2B